MTHPTNYKLKDGDTVELKVPIRVDRYWFDEGTMTRGSWDSHFMLAGCVGRVVKARTPAVHSPGGRALYFANVDIEYNGVKHRVRPFHDQLRRVRGRG